MAKKQKTKSASYKHSLKENITRNYKSLIVGLISVVVIVILLVNLLPSAKNKPPDQKKSGKVQINKQESNQDKENSNQNIYQVNEGDNLWIIAEKIYGSGFNAYDIAKANNISDPYIIEVGQKLKIPPPGEITTKAAQTVRSSENKTYTVKSGDHLWKIAEEVYGDGLMWVKIAKANNLANPDLIHPGNIFTLPD